MICYFYVLTYITYFSYFLIYQNNHLKEFYSIVNALYMFLKKYKGYYFYYYIWQLSD